MHSTPFMHSTWVLASYLYIAHAIVQYHRRRDAFETLNIGCRMNPIHSANITSCSLWFKRAYFYALAFCIRLINRPHAEFFSFSPSDRVEVYDVLGQDEFIALNKRCYSIHIESDSGAFCDLTGRGKWNAIGA